MQHSAIAPSWCWRTRGVGAAVGLRSMAGRERTWAGQAARQPAAPNHALNPDESSYDAGPAYQPSQRADVPGAPYVAVPTGAQGRRRGTGRRCAGHGSMADGKNPSGRWAVMTRLHRTGEVAGGDERASAGDEDNRRGLCQLARARLRFRTYNMQHDTCRECTTPHRPVPAWQWERRQARRL